MRYTREEMEEHAKELMKMRESFGCWGEREIYKPSEKDVKSANIIFQLLTERD